MRTTAHPRKGLQIAAAFLTAGLIAATATGCSASASGSDDDAGGSGEVYVYDGGGAWGDAQREAYFEPFEKETGITVVPVPGDLPSAMRVAVEGGTPTMDAMVLSPFDVASWTDDDLLESIDYDAWTDVDPADFDPYPTEPTAVPMHVYATQIAYDPAQTGGDLTSWADFFDTEKFPGARTMGDGTYVTTAVFEAALLADGVPADELYPLDIDRAFAKLSELRPDILRFWTSGAESVQLLADGQVSATSAWNGRVDAVTKENPEIASTWNDAILTTDFWGIPKGATNPENAQKFIEFASRPDRQAAFANLITYSPTNALAYDDISTERQAELPTGAEHRDLVVPSSIEFWNSDSGDGRPWSEAIVDRWQTWLAG